MPRGLIAALLLPLAGPSLGSTPIHEIQGAGDASPLEGQEVTVGGIVSGDFQAESAARPPALGGFFLQSEVQDGDPATSDGVFVEDGPVPVDVSTGDRVTVTGTVRETGGETRIVAHSISVSGMGTVVPVELTLPAAATALNGRGDRIADLERFEGMLVRIPHALTVTGLYELERFGEVLLASRGRLMHFTNGNRPDAQGYAAAQEEQARRSLLLDDGSIGQNVAPIRYLRPDPARPGYSLRNGDTVTSLVGNLRYGRAAAGAGSENYRLVPAATPDFAATNPRPVGTPDVGGGLSIASFNVLNFFSNLDSGADICGPDGRSNCRGANSLQELSRQQQKIASAIVRLDADIVGLIEIENNRRASIVRLLGALNIRAGGDTYAFVDTGSLGSDAIRTAFVYKSGAVELIGAAAVLDASVDRRFDDSSNRPTLAQTFRHKASGGVLTVALNHLKSKGSSCDDLDDPDRGDGQANCPGTRAAAAAALVDWLATDPTGSGDADFLVIGDLNAYPMEDAVAVIEAAGYVNLLRDYVGRDAYTYVFRGSAGTLDHALASAELALQVKGAMVWHINADEPPALDYNLEFGRDPQLFDGTTPWRASDHDPVLVGVDPLPE